MIIVGTREIADKLGVQPGTVQQWRKRALNFPEPHLVLATGPIWDWTLVKKWATQTGRLDNKGAPRGNRRNENGLQRAARKKFGGG